MFKKKPLMYYLPIGLFATFISVVRGSCMVSTNLLIDPSPEVHYAAKGMQVVLHSFY
jgi:hypothetical protein